jgi:hypothetical protein
MVLASFAREPKFPEAGDCLPNPTSIEEQTIEMIKSWYGQVEQNFKLEIEAA